MSPARLVPSVDDGRTDTIEELVVDARTHRRDEGVGSGWSRGTDEAGTGVTLGGRVG